MIATKVIREKIAELPAGEVFTPSLFAGMGSRATIDMALIRLAKEGQVERIGRGLYVLPKSSRFGIKTMPAAEQIAKVVAEAEGAVVAMHGAEATRRLGLSTQMSTQPVFYTNGTSRNIRVGKLLIRLKHVAARKMLLAGRPAGKALSVLWYLGSYEVESSTFKRIAQKLPLSEFKALWEAKPSMLGWMAEAMNRYEEEIDTKNKLPLEDI